MTSALIVGLGSIGQRHARNLRHVCRDLRLSAVRATRLAPLIGDAGDANYGVSIEAALGIEIVDTLDAALAQRPTAVFVCNPTQLHLPVALAAARAGCHLFIEKPVSGDMAGTAELSALVDATGLVAQVGYQLRFHPCLLHAKVLLDTGAIGRLLAAEATFSEPLPAWHPWEDYRQSYAARQELGGGVIRTQIHDLDCVQWLVGPARTVCAVGGHLSRLDVDVDDTASILLACDHDGRDVPVTLQQSFAQDDRVRRYVFRGDEGTLEVDVVGAVTSVRRGGREVDRFAPAGFVRNDLYLDELRHFLACIAGQEMPRMPLSEGLLSLKVACAALQSMAERRAIQLD